METFASSAKSQPSTDDCMRSVPAFYHQLFSHQERNVQHFTCTNALCGCLQDGCNLHVAPSWLHCLALTGCCERHLLQSSPLPAQPTPLVRMDAFMTLYCTDASLLKIQCVGAAAVLSLISIMLTHIHRGKP